VLGTIVARFAALIGFGTAGWRARPTEPLITTRAQPPATATSRLSSPRLSIVVMPFSNLSNDPEQEYFADGITEDLTTDLSRISGSFVIARNTAFAYKGKPVDVKQIGRELGVRYVLEGSVRRTGDWVRVNVQLIDPENGAHLWANRFDTDRANLPEAQNEITGRLARTLNLELVAAADRRIEQERAVDPDARDIVMRGWTLYYRPPSPALRREAQRMFEQALELDARSVDARIGLATILVDDLVFGWSSSPQPAEARAEQLLLEALELDQNRSTTRHAMGVLRRSQNRLTESRIELETAVALDRNDAIAFFSTWRHADVPGPTRRGDLPHREIDPAQSSRPKFGRLLLGIGFMPSTFDTCRTGDRPAQDGAHRKSAVLVYPCCARGCAWPWGRSRRGEGCFGRSDQTQTRDQLTGAMAYQCPMEHEPSILGAPREDIECRSAQGRDAGGVRSQFPAWVIAARRTIEVSEAQSQGSGAHIGRTGRTLHNAAPLFRRLLLPRP